MINWEYFSTREWAIAIWVVVITIFILFSSKFRKSLFSLVKIIFSWKLQLLFWVLIFVFIGEVAIFCHITHTWKYFSVKDMTLWFLFAGLPMACSANTNLARDGSYFKNSVLSNIKFIVLVSFIINYYTFSLWFELILMPVTFLFGVMEAINEIQQKDIRFQRIFNFINIFLGIFLFGYATKSLICDYPQWINYTNIFSLIIPLILSLLYIPVAYFVAVIFDYEEMYMRVSWFQDKCSKRELRNRKWLIFLACKLSWRKINTFSKHYVHRLYPSMPREKFLDELKDFNGNRLFMQNIDNPSENE